MTDSPDSGRGGRRSSAPGLGVSHSNGVNSALSQVRPYTDEAALERVWKRLEMRRSRPALAPAMRAGVAAALVAAGVFLGISYERQRQGDAQVASVSSEVIQGPGVPSGPTQEGPRFGVPEQNAREADGERTRARRTVQRLSLPVKLGATDDGRPEEPAEIVAQAESNEVQPPAKPAWLMLAERGEFAASFQRLDESGGFDAVLATGASEELMMLVEVARFVGRQERAIQALRVVTNKHQADPNAPIAAMILGNLLRNSGDSVGAARAYALNRRLAPSGDFAEDALVGEFDMAQGAGDLARVERLRAEYEAEFPNGRHLETLRAETRRLAERSSSASSRSTGATRSGTAPSPTGLEPSPPNKSAPPAVLDEQEDPEGSSD